MLTTEVSKLVYNNIKHGIYLGIEFYPNFDRPGGYHPYDEVVFICQDPRNIQSILYRKDYFWYQLGVKVAFTNSTQKYTWTYIILPIPKVCIKTQPQRTACAYF